MMTKENPFRFNSSLKSQSEILGMHDGDYTHSKIGELQWSSKDNDPNKYPEAYRDKSKWLNNKGTQERKDPWSKSDYKEGSDT